MSTQRQNTEYYSDESDEYEQEMYRINEQHRQRALRQKQKQNYNNDDDDMEEYDSNRNEEQQLTESTASTAPTIKPIFQSNFNSIWNKILYHR